MPSGVLADALWGDAPPARPDDQVAVLMSRLRSVLGRDRIEHRDNGYLLRFDWLDAAELAALVDEMDRRHAAGNAMGAAAAARVALSLVRGSEPGPVPGEWAQLRRSELERLTSRARQAAAGVLLEAGDWMAAVDAATATMERDPYSEAALRILLRGYVMGGQVAAALAAYASARERLADDLGTDPSPETAALYTAILRGELATPAPLPATVTMGAIGRDDELAYLDAVATRARAGSVEIVVVDGEAGIGKTTLLRTWSARRAAAGDTVLTASCGQLDRSMPLDAVLTALAALLRRLGTETSADVLGGDAVILTPMLGAELQSGGQFQPGGQPGPRLPMLGDSVLGPAALYSALARVLGRLAEHQPLVVVIDDAHLAGSALHDWLRFVQREELAVTVVAAVRSGEPASLSRQRGDPPERPRPRGRHRAGRSRASGRALRAVQGPPAVPDRAGPAVLGRRAAGVPGRLGLGALRRTRHGRRRCCAPPRSSALNSTSTCSPRCSAAPSSTCWTTPSRRRPSSS